MAGEQAGCDRYPVVHRAIVAAPPARRNEEQLEAEVYGQ
jgi:hypothetical protein